jgi:soluble lytic murein transglycosylase-like protein
VSAAAAIARVAELQSLFGVAPPRETPTPPARAAPTAFADALSSATAPSATASTASVGSPAPSTAGATAGATGLSELPASVPYGAEITAAAKRNGLDPALLAGLVKQESGFNANARSGAGAQGLTQLMPSTASGLGVHNPLDPAQSLEGGAKYLAQQLKAFDGDVARALAAYNAGPGAVQRFGGVPPYAETQNYVRAVQSNAAAFRGGSSSTT